MTMPQIILLNHASYMNNKRSEAASKTEEEPGAMYRGKSIDKCNSDELQNYYSDFLA